MKKSDLELLYLQSENAREKLIQMSTKTKFKTIVDQSLPNFVSKIILALLAYFF